MGHRGEGARRAQTLETVDQFVAVLALADHYRRQLSVALQRSRHGPLRLRQVQSITAVVFTDLVHVEGQRTLLHPAHHRRLPDLKSKKRERRKTIWTPLVPPSSRLCALGR